MCHIVLTAPISSYRYLNTSMTLEDFGRGRDSAALREIGFDVANNDKYKHAYLVMIVKGIKKSTW